MYRLLCIFTLIFTVSIVQAESTCADCPPEFGLSTEEIEANPEPELERLLPNMRQLYYRNYYQVNGAADIYDAPNGNIIKHRPEGSYFVTVTSFGDGWTEINPGEWIRSDQLTLAPISHLGGVFLDETPYPVGWLKTFTQPSRSPGAHPDPSDLAIANYTFIYVYATMDVEGVEWAQIGVNQWVERSRLAVIDTIARPADVDTDKWVAIDLTEQVAVAYEGRQPVFAALISTGVEQAPTEEGLFHIYARYHTRTMNSDASKPWFYYVEDVPYTLFFNGHEALHGTYWHDRFGYPRSHGCINFSLTDGAWLYNWLAETVDFTDTDAVWPVVYVYSS